MGSSKKEQDENEKYRRFQAEMKRKQERQADSLAYLQMRTHEPDQDGRYLVRVMVRVRWDDGGEVLAILSTDGENGKEVGFGQGEELLDALTNASNRWANGQVKWRKDEYG